VIGNALGPVRVVGERATEGKAELFREFPGDLALLRVTEQGTLRCEAWPPATNVGATLQSQTNGHLTTREPDGSRTLIPVMFRSIDVDRVFVRPTVAGDQLLKGAALNAVQVAEQDLPRRMEQVLEEKKEKIVIIKADVDVEYGAVMAAMDTLRASGIEDMGLITETRRPTAAAAGAGGQ
jgi:hypothetical protein